MKKKKTHFNNTIFWKFLLAYILFAVFGTIATGTFIKTLVDSHVQNERSERMYSAAVRIANTYAADLYDTKTTLESVQAELKVLSDYMDSDIWIINPSGRLVIDTSRELSSDEEIVIEGFDPTITGGRHYTTGRFFDSFEEDEISVFAPITASYKVRAYVIIHTPMRALTANVDSIMNICYMLMIVVFFLSLIILIFFAEMVYIPVRRITEGAEQYAAGNMDYRMNIDSDDEIGYLSATLGYMSGEIARTEQDQRKFIANVSHDFRSPLTSIRGYLDAMIDGTIPPKMHERYLTIVRNETDRLTKLTNGLLSLNNLSGQSVMMNRADFDLNDMIRQTVSSFEGQCAERGITFDLLLTDEVMIVSADPERIQQVLYNLVDNAIKFSHDKGVITIETTERGRKVFISVKDDGIGIPKEELNLVFDRFYKSDASRGKDKKGTGLGLSIVKEIIKNHGENINVISTVGVGTEFIFSLEKSEEMDRDED